MDKNCRMTDFHAYHYPMNCPMMMYRMEDTEDTDNFEERINKLKSEVSDLSDHEIKLRLVQDVASLKDGHTVIQQYIEPYSFYPLRLWWFGNELRVIDSRDKYKDIVGFKLTAINKIPIAEVMNRINTLVPQENNQWPKNFNISLLHADVLNFLNISDKKDV